MERLKAARKLKSVHEGKVSCFTRIDNPFAEESSASWSCHPSPQGGGWILRQRPHLIHGSLDRQRHIDRFSRFCTAHPCAKHTDRQTGNCSNRPHHSMHCLQATRPHTQLIPTQLNSAHPVSISGRVRTLRSVAPSHFNPTQPIPCPSLAGFVPCVASLHPISTQPIPCSSQVGFVPCVASLHPISTQLIPCSSLVGLVPCVASLRPTVDSSSNLRSLHLPSFVDERTPRLKYTTRQSSTGCANKNRIIVLNALNACDTVRRLQVLI